MVERQVCLITGESVQRVTDSVIFTRQYSCGCRVTTRPSAEMWDDPALDLRSWLDRHAEESHTLLHRQKDERDRAAQASA